MTFVEQTCTGARLTERSAMFELQSRDPGSKNSKEDEFQEKFNFN